MAINLYNIRKWSKMIAGKSVLHVNQDIGKVYSKDKVKGYYNNLTKKVTFLPQILHTDKLPTLHTEKGEDVYFPVAIFQYGLGAYDLFLQTKEDTYLKKFEQCCKWALENQQEDGAWNNFFYIYPSSPYGSMAQGEGASLLLRAFVESNKATYKTAAEKALEFMLRPISEGGTSLYTPKGIELHEYTHLPLVLNGFIFSWWGLYDYALVDQDNDKIKSALKSSLNVLETLLPKFDNGYWSRYDLAGKIASPFYHNLHIAQMEAMYSLTGDNIFKKYADKWLKEQNNKFNYSRAFITKAIQKIKE